MKVVLGVIIAVSVGCAIVAAVLFLFDVLYGSGAAWR